MPGLGGYDNVPVDLVGPVNNWLGRRRERQQNEGRAAMEHGRNMEHTAMMFQGHLALMNQGHANDLERIKAKTNSRRTILRTAGDVLNQMPEGSTLSSPKVRLTRDRAAAPPETPSAAAPKAPTTRNKPATPRAKAPAAPEPTGRHAGTPARERKNAKPKPPGRHAAP